MAACLACGVLAVMVKPLWLGVAFAIAALLALLGGAAFPARAAPGDRAAMDDIFLENSSASAQIMNSIGIPALLFDSDGRILWANAALRDLYDGKDVKSSCPAWIRAFPRRRSRLSIAGGISSL